MPAPKRTIKDLACNLARDLARARGLAHALALEVNADPGPADYCALARALALDRSLARDADPSIALDRGLALARYRDLARALGLDVNVGLALALARDPEIELDRYHGRALKLDPEIDLGFDLDLDRAVDRDRAVNRARAVASARAFNRDLDHAVVKAPDLDFALAVDLAVDLAVASAVASARARARDGYSYFDRYRFREQVLHQVADRDLSRFRGLDHDREWALHWMAERDRSALEAEVGGRYQMAQVLLFLTRYTAYASWLTAAIPQETDDKMPEVSRLHDVARKACLDLYVTCAVHALRLEGKIPAVGGIRVVKERFTGESPGSDPPGGTSAA